MPTTREPTFTGLSNRGLILLAIVGLLVISLAAMQYRSILQRNQEATSNLNVIAGQLAALMNLRAMQTSLYRNMNLFLLDPDKKNNRLAVDSLINRSSTELGYIKTVPGLENQAVENLLSALHGQFQTLNKEIQILFEIRTDPARQYPALAKSTDMMPFQDIVEGKFSVLLSEIESGEFTPQQATVYPLLLKVVTTWARSLSQMRIYYANRFGSFDISILNQQIHAVDNFYVQLMGQLEELQQLYREEADSLEGEPAIIAMQDAAKAWYRIFQEVRHINESARWREDGFVLESTIIPLLDDIARNITQIENISRDGQQMMNQNLAKNSQHLVLIIIAIIAFVLLFIVSVVIAMKIKAQQTLQRLNVELEQRVGERTDELSQANLQITDLNKRLQFENSRMQTELDVARRLQQMVLPKAQELAAISDLDIAAFMEPADEIGGDYYDIIRDHNGIKIGIGDVTGHGLESGVLMIMVQMAVRTLLINQVSDPNVFLEVLNQAVFDNVQRMESDKNLTLSLLDYKDGKLRLSGQHEEVLLVRKNGKVQRIDTVDLGFMIGLTNDISEFVGTLDITLDSGDGIVLYTDGITEARNLNKEFYGLERLCLLIGQQWSKRASVIQESVIADVRRHIGSQQLKDDITLLVLKKV